jgi:serine palmitoyltransferase
MCSQSFSGMGGYIASSKQVIDYIRCQSAGILYHNSLSPVVSQQILTAFKVIMGEDGTSVGKEKLSRLIENSNFFRSEMMRLGLHVYGDFDSPIIPVLIYFPAKVAAFSRECLKRGVAIVVVGFPATSVILSRARFCISAGHTREDLIKAVKVIDEVAQLICLKYEKSLVGY